MEPEITPDAPAAGDVDVGEELIPAQPGEGVAGTEGEPTEAPAEPVAPEPEPQFRLPGQEDMSDRELTWFRQQYGSAMEAIQQYRQKLEEYELAGMDEEEVKQYKAQQEYHQLRQEVDALRMERATEQWRDYYRQFAPSGVDLIREQNPVNMQHQVLTNLHTKVQALEKENAALKKALSGQPKGTPVTTGGSGAPQPSSLWDLNQTKEQREEIFRQAKMGLLGD